MQFRRAPILVPVVLTLVGCVADLSIQPGTQISCEEETDCPRGFRCFTDLGQCVRENSDTTPATVVSLEVTPTRARRGTTVTLTLTVDQLLSVVPSIDAEWGGATPGSRALTYVGNTSMVHTLEYVVGDEEPEGFVSFSIALVNEAGVVSELQQPRALELDFSEPQLLAGTQRTVITPAPGSLITAVTAATTDSAVEVLFAVNELLGNLQVSATGPQTLAFQCDPPLGTFYTCSFVVPTGTAEGDYALVASATDLAGNTAQLSLPGLTIDTTAPSPPDQATRGAITYQRIPSGADESAGVPRFSVEGIDGSVEQDATVIVFDTANTSTGTVLGSSQASATGSIPSFDVAAANRPRLYLLVVDGAGNPSDADAAAGVQASLVLDIHWRATLAGKVAGSLFENPHRITRRGWFGDGLSQPDSVEISGMGAFGAVDGITQQTFGAGDWRVSDNGSIPPSATEHIVEFDSWRAVAVYMEPDETPIDIWNWNGDAWLQVTQTLDPEGDGDPVPRNFSAMAFDSRRGEMVLFGGFNNSVERNDTWLWNGTSWRRAFPATSPSERFNHRMVYDETRDRVVLFGGDEDTSFGGELADTWEWDGTTWQETTPVTSPTNRAGYSFAYDTVRGEAVLYGGGSRAPMGMTECGDGVTASSPGGPCDFNDTWVYNGTWVRRCDSDAGTPDCDFPPSARSSTMEFDRARGVAVLFGGLDTTCPDAFDMCDETWEWNGTDWAQASPVDVLGDGNPTGRVDAKFFYDTHRNEMVMVNGDNEFVGCDGTFICTDIMWLWDGAEWSQRLNIEAAVPLAGARTNAGLVHDAANNELVLFGGRVNGPGSLNEDITWTFDGRQWTDTALANPEGRSGPGLVYHSGIGEVLLFGGENFDIVGSGSELNDTWLWDGTTWSGVTSPTNPPPRSDPAVAYDSDNDVVLLFGGRDSVGTGGMCPGGQPLNGSVCYLDDTWGFGVWGTMACGSPSARCWQQLESGVPGRGYAQAMAYDEARDVMVMFGGWLRNDVADALEAQDITWEWSGATWVEVDSGSIPGRREHSMAYDASREKVIVFGGSIPVEFGLCPATGDTVCNDVWEWDGTTWRERTASDPTGDGRTGVRFQQTMAYHAVDEVTYLIDGGNSAAFPEDPTSFFWQWDGGAGATPAQTAEFALAETGEPDIAPDSMEVRWVAGGEGFPGGTRMNGASLSLWQQGQWAPFDNNTSPPTLPGDLGFCIYDPALTSAPPPGCIATPNMDRVLLGSRRSLYISAESAAPNGTSDARIVTDYIEVSVRYRIASP